MTETLQGNIQNSTQASMKDVSVDELLDDTVGLSFKSIRTIWSLFKNPLEYFQAARAPFWENRFSPSFRVYAGLMAISTGMRFLWRDEDSPMVIMYSQLFQQIKDKPPEGLDPAIIDPTAMAITTLKWYILIMPIALMLGYMFLGLVYWGYGEKLNPVVRIRYIFASMIPSSVVGFLMILPMFYAPTVIAGPVSFLAMLIMFGAVWITLYRGAFPAVPTKGGKAGRATAVTALNLIFMMIAATIGLVAGIVMAMKEAVASGVVT